MTDQEKLAKELAGLGHPTRLVIVGLLGDATTLSPRQATDLIDGPKLGAVAHHFRALSTAGLVEQVRTRPVRGAVEHFYSLTERGRQLAATLGL